jgi:mono/diheme cytochrome c family protein
MTRQPLTTALAFLLAAQAGLASATTASELLADYSRKAGNTAAVDRGRAFFNATHGREWSCASCHGATPTGGGKHASTGKPIGALAPAANTERFTDAA